MAYPGCHNTTNDISQPPCVGNLRQLIIFANVFFVIFYLIERSLWGRSLQDYMRITTTAKKMTIAVSESHFTFYPNLVIGLIDLGVLCLTKREYILFLTS